jgi:hypothetical protein
MLERYAPVSMTLNLATAPEGILWESVVFVAAVILSLNRPTADGKFD